jgi:prepilin-type N-terminal cleavage/methylation domain-containing protein
MRKRGPYMQRNMHCSHAEVRTGDGFSLIETIIVLAVIAILSAIMLPSYAQWVRDAECKSSARNVFMVLRETRSKAIVNNLEHRVEFESTKRRYCVKQGDRSNNSTQWIVVVHDWIDLPAGLQMDANIKSIQMNPNGTANGGTIRIKNDTLAKSYDVVVARTGRIRIAAK